MTDLLTVWSMLLLAGKWLFIVVIYAALFVILSAVRQEARLRLAGEPATGGVPAAPGRLRILEGGTDLRARPGQTLDLQPVTTLGAAPDNTLPLADQYVSSHHARLSWDGAGWWVEDLGSANGTLVEGRPCPPHTRCRLPLGARLMLGDMALELVE